MNESIEEQSEARRNLMVEIFGAVVSSFALGLVLPFLGVMVLRYGGSAWEVAVIAAAPAAANMLAIFWGKLTRKIGRVKLILVFHGAARLAVLGFAFAEKSTAFVALAIAYFFLQAVASPAYVGLMRSIYPERIRGRYMSYVRITSGLASVLGIYASGAWFDDRFRAAALVGFALGAIGIAAFAWIREPERYREELKAPANWGGTLQAFKLDRKFQFLLLGVFIYEFFYLLPASAYPVYQVETMNLSNAQIGQLSIASTAAVLLFSPLWGKMIDRYSTMPVLLLSALAGAMLPFAYWIAPGMAAITAGTFAAGAAAAGIDLAWINYLSRSAGKHLTSFSGIYLSLVGVRGVVAPLCGVAVLKLADMGTLFALSGCMLLLSLLPFLRLRSLSIARPAGDQLEERA